MAVDSGGEPSYHFSPANLTAFEGGEISVVGGTVEPHTFTHDVAVNDRLFDSGQVSVGQTKLVRAPTTDGVFPFHCSYHPGMTGTLTVVAPPHPTSPAPASATGIPAPGAALVALALAGGALLVAKRRR